MASFVPDTARSAGLQVEMGTKAWCKMYEILVAYELAPPTPKCNTVHLCEAPGAFITATNHYLRQMYVTRPHIARLLVLREHEIASALGMIPCLQFLCVFTSFLCTCGGAHVRAESLTYPHILTSARGRTHYQPPRSYRDDLDFNWRAITLNPWYVAAFVESVVTGVNFIPIPNTHAHQRNGGGSWNACCASSTTVHKLVPM